MSRESVSPTNLTNSEAHTHLDATAIIIIFYLLHIYSHNTLPGASVGKTFILWEYAGGDRAIRSHNEHPAASAGKERFTGLFENCWWRIPIQSFGLRAGRYGRLFLIPVFRFLIKYFPPPLSGAQL